MNCNEAAVDYVTDGGNGASVLDFTGESGACKEDAGHGDWNDAKAHYGGAKQTKKNALDTEESQPPSRLSGQAGIMPVRFYNNEMAAVGYLWRMKKPQEAVRWINESWH